MLKDNSFHRSSWEGTVRKKKRFIWAEQANDAQNNHNGRNLRKFKEEEMWEEEAGGKFA